MEERFSGMKESVAKAQDLYQEGLERGRDLVKTASDKSKEAIGLANDWTRENPWIVLGVVAGIGLLLGILLSSGGRKQS